MVGYKAYSTCTTVLNLLQEYDGCCCLQLKISFKVIGDYFVNLFLFSHHAEIIFFNSCGQ